MATALRYPEPTPCTEHGDIVVYATAGGWPDDHVVQQGYCTTCGWWIARTSFANGEIEERPLAVEQISILKLMAQSAEEIV